MALRICPECKAKFSRRAAQCPQCGYRRTSLGTLIIAGIMGLAAIISVKACSDNNAATAARQAAEQARVASLTPAQRQAEAAAATRKAQADAARNEELSAVAACRGFVRNAVRDPDSLSFLQMMSESYVKKLKDGSYNAQVKTRAANGFGGKTISVFDCTLSPAGDTWRLVKLKELH